MRYKKMSFTGTPLITTPDTIVYGTFKTSDRIFEVLVSDDAALPTTGNLDVGFNVSNDAHDGAVLDIDLIMDNQAFTSAQARVDRFTDGVLGDLDRGKTIWELLALGAQSYTEDPQLNVDLVGTVVTASFDALSVHNIEVYYTSGD
jgi:hypothetical protein